LIADYLVRSNLTVFERGVQKHLAAKFGVSSSTISRDIRFLFAFIAVCPTCGRPDYPIPRLLLHDDPED